MPPITGMLLSRIIKSYFSASSLSNASEPLTTTSTSWCAFFRTWLRIILFTGLSSATKTLSVFVLTGFLKSAIEATFVTSTLMTFFARVISNQNLLPTLCWLSTPIWPPISLTKCMEMAVPKPVPPYLYLMVSSA